MTSKRKQKKKGQGNKKEREEREGGEGGRGRTPHLLSPSHHTTPIDILPVLQDTFCPRMFTIK